jgi:DNA-binding transcriptional MerR regulator
MPGLSGGQYMTPGNAARRAGVQPGTLIDWESQGLLSAARDGRGHRLYLAADIEEIRARRESQGRVAASPGTAGLLAAEEATALFGVHSLTVSRWAKEGRLLWVLTPGGHRRFFTCELTALLSGWTREEARDLALAERARLAESATGRAGLLTPGEVAVLFRVDPKTVTEWEGARLLVSVRTVGGTRRYFGSQVRALLTGESPEAARKLGLADRERLTGEQP